MNNLFNRSRILHTIIFYALLFYGVYILYSIYGTILFFRMNSEYFYTENLIDFLNNLKNSQDVPFLGYWLFVVIIHIGLFIWLINSTSEISQYSYFLGYGLFAVVLHIGLSIWLKPHQWKLKDCYKIYWFILLQIGLCALPFILILL